MSRYHLSTSHLWAEQQVSIKGRTFFHRRCQICERDFARSLVEGEWRAVYIGVLSLDFLDEKITQRWMSEDCPGRPLPGEAYSHEEKCIPAPNVEQAIEENLDLEPRLSGAKLTTVEVANHLKVHPSMV